MKKLVLFCLAILLISGCTRSDEAPQGGSSQKKDRSMSDVARDKYGKDIKELTTEEFKDVGRIWMNE